MKEQETDKDEKAESVPDLEVSSAQAEETKAGSSPGFLAFPSFHGGVFVGSG